MAGGAGIYAFAYHLYPPPSERARQAATAVPTPATAPDPLPSAPSAPRSINFMASALEPSMGLAYNNRCLIRAITGRDLVAGLQDCGTAQKLMPLNIGVRITRGFIYLKLGDPRLALKQYDDALNVDPNRPLALYGRGIARIMVGGTRQGEDDRAAALTLDPEVADQFAIYGLK